MDCNTNLSPRKPGLLLDLHCSAATASSFPAPQLVYNFPSEPRVILSPSLWEITSNPVRAKMESGSSSTYHKIFSEDHMCIDNL